MFSLRESNCLAFFVFFFSVDHDETSGLKIIYKKMQSATGQGASTKDLPDVFLQAGGAQDLPRGGGEIESTNRVKALLLLYSSCLSRFAVPPHP